MAKASMIEMNDTLTMTPEQGFPTELSYKKHISKPNGFFKAEMFENKIFTFTGKEDLRVFKVPPVRNFLVEKTKEGKWIYWGLCHIIETTMDYVNKMTTGKYKIIYINSPDEMKKAFELIDRSSYTNFFNN